MRYFTQTETLSLQFDKKYGKNHPVFFPGTYTEALEKSRKEFKILLAILYLESHQDMDLFCSHVVCDPAINDFIREKECIVWMGDVQSKEGNKVYSVLSVDSFPFMAFISPKGSKMVIFDRIQGFFFSKSY